MTDNSDVIRNDTIEFPRGIAFGETRDLLIYLGIGLPIVYGYVEDTYGECRHRRRGGTRDFEGIESFILRGSITKRGVSGISYKFRTGEVRSGKDNMPRAHEFCFEERQDYNSSEHREGVVQLWDDTRRVIGKYFAEYPSE
jgi:hypothetical protein